LSKAEKARNLLLGWKGHDAGTRKGRHPSLVGVVDLARKSRDAVASGWHFG